MPNGHSAARVATMPTHAERSPQVDAARAERQEALRESIIRLTQGPESPQERVPLGIAAIDDALGGGLSRCGVHEWIGIGDRPRLRMPPLGVLIHAAWMALGCEAADRRRHAVWIGRACHAPASTLVRGLRGVVDGRRPTPDRSLLDRSIFIDAETPQERAWAIEQAARCPGVFLVVGDGAGFDAALSRRVQLAAQRRSLVLLSRLDQERQALSVAMTRWLVQPEPCGRREFDGITGTIGVQSPDEGPPLEWPAPPGWRLVLLRSKQACDRSIRTATTRGQ